MYTNFTQQQQEKLTKLEEESGKILIQKQKLSKRLGIPIAEIVDVNIFRMASLFGIIKQNDSSESVLSFLFNDSNNNGLYPNYINCNNCITEKIKLIHVQKHIAVQVITFNKWITKIVENRLKILHDNDIDIMAHDNTFQSFHEACLSQIDPLVELLTDDPEYWVLEHLCLIRSSLFGFIDPVSNNRIARQHIKQSQIGNLQPNINHLTPYEQITLLFNGFKNTIIDGVDIKNAMYISHFMRDPIVQPFNMSDFVKKCCNPTLMFCTLEEILTCNLLGPYLNNNVGYLAQNDTFYVLYKIDSNIRYWVSDPQLSVLTTNIGKKLVCFLFRTFRQFFAAIFGDNKFMSSHDHPRNLELTLLIKNWNTAKDLQSLGKFIMKLIKTKSPILATEFDKFNVLDSKHIIPIKLKHLACNNLYDM